jgi:hypothetical protein
MACVCAYVGLSGGEEEAPIGRFYSDALLPTVNHSDFPLAGISFSQNTVWPRSSNFGYLLKLTEHERAPERKD